MTTRCETDPRANRKDDTEITLASDFGYETNKSSVFIRANSPCVARRDHSTRISAMKCVHCIHMKSTFLPPRERLAFIRSKDSSPPHLMEKLLFETFPLATNQTSLINTMRKLTSFRVSLHDSAFP